MRVAFFVALLPLAWGAQSSEIHTLVARRGLLQPPAIPRSKHSLQALSPGRSRHSHDVRRDGRSITPRGSAALASAQGESPKSTIIIDRHVHKTGGTTVRKIFQLNHGQGECWYWGYGVPTRSLRQLVDEIKVSDGSSRICIEQHMTEDVPADHEMLRELRADGHSVHQVTRVREPFDYYLSYFKWSIIGQQLNNHTGSGSSFLDWAPTNLQANLLLNPNLSPAVEYGSGRTAEGDYQCLTGFDDGKYETVVNMLDEYEIVGTTEKFAEFVQLLKQTTGLPHTSYQQSVPDQRYLPQGHATVTDEEICPDMQACRDHVARLTPYDQKLYERYARRFDERLQREGEALRLAVVASQPQGASTLADVASREEAVRAGSHHAAAMRIAHATDLVAPYELDSWYGGEPPSAKCAWQVTDSPPVYDGDPCAPVTPTVGLMLQGFGVGRIDAQAENCCMKFSLIEKRELEASAHVRRASTLANLTAAVAPKAAALPRVVDLEATEDGRWREAAHGRAAVARRLDARVDPDVWPALWRRPA